MAVMSTLPGTEVFVFAGFYLDPRQRLLFGPEGEPVPLSARAFDTLLFLVEHPNQLVDKQTLMKAVWPNVIVEENNLNQNISIVRRALGETPGEHRFVVTVPGRGFRFVPTVTQRSSLAEALAGAQPITSEGPAPDPVRLLAVTPEPAKATAATDVAIDAPEMAIDSRNTAAEETPSRARAYWVWPVAVLSTAVLALGGYYWIRHRATHELAAANPSTQQPASSTGHEPSIAVLPFVNMSADTAQDYFSDGLTEELATQLGQLRGLRVVGRASAFAFKGKNEDLRLIGTALGVDHILEGSVRRVGNELRITAELVDSANGSRLWSQVYERKLEDVFAVQQQISEAVANEISAKLQDDTHAQPSPEAQSKDGRKVTVAAYEAYLSATTLLNTLGSLDLRSAIARLQRSVELDSQFSLAWSRLATAYANLPDSDPSLVQVGDEAVWHQDVSRAAARAHELAPNSAAALDAMAALAMLEQRWLEAGQLLRSQLAQSNVEDYEANSQYALFLLNVGRARESIQYFQRASRAEPLFLAPAVRLQFAYDIAGDAQQAQLEFEKLSGLIGDPYFATLPSSLRAFERHDTQAMRASLLARVGKDDVLVKALDDPAAAAHARQFYRDYYVNPAVRHRSFAMRQTAEWANWFGDDELALQAMGNFGPSLATYFIWRPEFAHLRRLPQFKALVRELKLVDFWRASGNWGDFCHPTGPDDFECR